MENNIKVGLLVIATQKYDTFLKPLFETADEFFLKDCEVNFDKDNFGGQLTIKAPNARLPNISPDSPVESHPVFYALSERI